VTDAEHNILLIGYGNPGRRDDGLGPAVAETVRAWDVPGLTVESNYQLTVEDSHQAARHRVVLFADAAESGPEPFWIERLHPADGPASFSTHSVTPQAVLALAREVFSAEPAGYLLGIRGYQFDQFGETLSKQARANLQAAVAHLRPMLQDGQIREHRP
jgi:hydrogenase maturation protease